MPTIDDLNSVTSISDGDQLPLFVSGSRTTRRATVSQLRSAILTGSTIPGGLLADCSVFAMHGTPQSPVAVSLTTTPTPFNTAHYVGPNYSLPGQANSVQFDPSNGRFIALRDIQAIEFQAAVWGTWPSANDLVLSVQVGDPANFYTAAMQATVPGGATNTRTAGMFGFTTNRNDSLGYVRAGQVMRLVASSNTTGTLNLSRIHFSITLMDGQ